LRHTSLKLFEIRTIIPAKFCLVWHKNYSSSTIPLVFRHTLVKYYRIAVLDIEKINYRESNLICLLGVTNASLLAYAIAGYNYYISGRGGIQMGFGGFGNNNGGCGIIIIIIILLLFFCFNDDGSSDCC